MIVSTTIVFQCIIFTPPVITTLQVDMDLYHNCWYILSYVCQHVYFVFENLNNSVITAIQLPTTNPCGGSLSVVLSKEKLGMLQSKVVPSLLSILNVPLKGKKTLVIIILSNYQL